jgi:hypothetical protein
MEAPRRKQRGIDPKGKQSICIRASNPASQQGVECDALCVFNYSDELVKIYHRLPNPARI